MNVDNNICVSKSKFGSHGYEFNDICGMVSYLKEIIYSNVSSVVERCDKHEDYIWIDTKYNVIDGLEYQIDDKIHGQNTIYAWIQGRGIEALAGHISYLKKYHGNESTALVGQIRNILKLILFQLSKIRAQCGGHVYFFMDQSGTPFTFDESGNRKPTVLTTQSPYNFSDLFCAKGMYAAAKTTENHDLASEARKYCLDVTKAIQTYTIVSDQYQFDKNNPVGQVTGRKSHASFMIQIGAMALMVSHEKDNSFVETGLKLIEYVLDNYVNTKNKFSKLEEFDFVEFLDSENQPWSQDGKIISDPGHALEFVGLAFKFTDTVKRLRITDCDQKNRLCRIESVLPKIFKQNFRNGFQPQLGGICKLFDLITRNPINSDMPWWSLPETIRAALYCWQNEPSVSAKQNYLEIANECSRCFKLNYIVSERDMMPIQNRCGDGKIAHTICLSKV